MPAWLKGDLPREPAANEPEAGAGEQPSAVRSEIEAEAPAEALPDALETAAAERGDESTPAGGAARQPASAAGRPLPGAVAAELDRPEDTHVSSLELAQVLAETQALEAFVDAGGAVGRGLTAVGTAEGAQTIAAASEPGAGQMADEPTAALKALGAEEASGISEPAALAAGRSDEIRAAAAQPAEAGQAAIDAGDEGPAPAPGTGQRRTRKGKVTAGPRPVGSAGVASVRAGEPAASAEFGPMGLAEPVVQLGLEALIESLLFVADGAAPVARLAEALEVSPREIEAALTTLSLSYQQRGLSLQRFRDRVQLTTAPAAAERVERFLGLAAASPLSRASLETLAIIAYQQPVTRPQIDAVRGVNSDSVLKNLLSKGLVEEAGRAEGPGRPVLYSTTPEFMQHFGLASLSDLPPLSLPEPSGEGPAPEAILKG